MSVKIAAWNIREGLAQAEEMPEVIEHVKALDADVVVLSDAYSLTNDLHGSSEEALASAYANLDTMGYATYETEYDDEKPWHHDRHIVLLSRLAVVRSAVLRLATRNALAVGINDSDTKDVIHILGVHFDDRQEATRVRQAAAVLDYVGPKQPTILSGDLNCTHPSDWLPRRLNTKTSRRVAKYMPQARARSNFQRAVDMASGYSLAILQGGGLSDADPEHRATWGPKIPLLQLDHHMLTPNLRPESLEIGERSDVSDHRSVTVTVATQ